MITTHLPDFAAALSPYTRLLGLDPGSKTIGIASSDAMRAIATPVHTIQRSKLTKDILLLQQICVSEQVGGLVIGYPLNMDGSAGPRCQSVRAFARQLQQALELPIILYDERLTTVAAERAMLEADLSRQKRANRVDNIAACYMLQGVLDALAAM